MTPQDFLHLPCEILGDAYDNLIANAINEAANLAPDSVGDQKNIVSFRYWEAVINVLMLEPAKQERGYEAEEFTEGQLAYAQTQLSKHSRIAALYIADVGSSGYFQAVY